MIYNSTEMEKEALFNTAARKYMGKQQNTVPLIRYMNFRRHDL